MVGGYFAQPSTFFFPNFSDFLSFFHLDRECNLTAAKYYYIVEIETPYFCSNTGNYYYLNTVTLPFDDAEFDAATVNRDAMIDTAPGRAPSSGYTSHLAIITSQAEEDCIIYASNVQGGGSTTPQSWIGLRKSGSGEFWVDKSSMDYAGRKLSNTHTQEHCFRLTGHESYDYSGSGK